MIKIIGTSHVSPQSLKEIASTIDKLKPDCVAVELDPNRYEALRRGDHVNISAVKYIGFRNYLVAKILSIVQEHLGKKTGVMPGEEMLKAVDMGRKVGADIALIDRDIRITLDRMRMMRLAEKLRILLGVFKKVPVEEKFDLKEVPAEKLVDHLVDHIKTLSPTLYNALIHERDVHMARALYGLSQKYENIVAVVGVGHARGIKRELDVLSKKSTLSPSSRSSS